MRAWSDHLKEHLLSKDNGLIIRFDCLAPAFTVLVKDHPFVGGKLAFASVIAK